MVKKQKTRGIILISVLFFVVVLVMFAATVSLASLSQQRNSSAFYMNMAASKAAEAGLNYAMARLSRNPEWTGCGPNNQPFECKPNSGIEVYEHPVSAGTGCIEGKISMGQQSAYFDMYFAKPPNGSTMHFFKDDGEAGSMPERIILCQNNNDNMAHSSIVYSDGSLVGRQVPEKATLLVCRGRAGNVVKTIETCIRLGPGANYNTAAMARGSLEIKIHGSQADNDKLTLIKCKENGNKSSIIRSKGEMIIGLGSGSSYTNDDYIDAQFDCGGRAEPKVPSLQPFPNQFGLNFQCEASQDKFLKKVTMSQVMPSSSELTNIPIKLPAGTYFITARKANEANFDKYPRVYYVNSDDTTKIGSLSSYDTDFKPVYEGVGEDRSDEFKNLIDGDKMKWDYQTRRLVIAEDCRVSPQGSLKNLILASGGLPAVSYTDANGVPQVLGNTKERITIALGKEVSDPYTSSAKKIKPVKLINDNADSSIYVGGQLSGVGTVISAGNIVTESQSQIEPDMLNGIELFAEETIQLQEISVDPYINLNKNYVPSYFSGNVRDQLPDLVGAHNDSLRLYRKVLEYAYSGDRAAAQEVSLPKSMFTSEEWTQLETYFGATGDVWVHKYPNQGTISNTAQGKSIVPLLANPVGKSFQDMIQDKNLESSGVYTADGRQVDAQDTIFRGLVYSCNSLKVNSPGHSFAVEGGIVALGDKEKAGSTSNPDPNPPTPPAPNPPPTGGSSSGGPKDPNAPTINDPGGDSGGGDEPDPMPIPTVTIPIPTPQDGIQPKDGGLADGGAEGLPIDMNTIGSITIDAKNCVFTYNSKYLGLLSKSEDSAVEILYWSISD